MANQVDVKANIGRLVKACRTVIRQHDGGYPVGHDAIVELHRALKKQTPELSRKQLDETGQRDDLDAIAHHLAYEYCVSAFDGCLDDVSEQVGVDGWRDLDNAATNYDPEEHLDYLERRGLIQRDEKNHNWIAVLDESEASR